MAHHRVWSQLQRIAEFGIDPAQHQIDRFQTLHGLQEKPVVANGEIGALDDRIAQITGQIGMLEIGRFGRARRQHHGQRRIASRMLQQPLAERAKE